MNRSFIFGVSTLLFVFSVGHLSASPADKAAGAVAVAERGPDLTGVGITEKLGSLIDLNRTFTDETGKPVQLKEFFSSKRPVVFSLAYYECPMLCGVVLNALVDGLKGMDWTPGKEFTLVNLSFDPKEKFDLAAAKKRNLIEALGKSEAAAGWHFLTGEESQIKALADELGFGYRWDEKEKQYAHGAGIFVLTPEGKLSRVLYGIQYRPSDLRLSLLEASNGKIGTIVDRILLFCFSYNPHLRQYSVTATRVVQIGSVFTILILGGWIAFSRMRELRSRPRSS